MSGTSTARGQFLTTAPIVLYYYTQLTGDAKKTLTLLAATSFDAMAVIGRLTMLFHTNYFYPALDANLYLHEGSGAQYWINQDKLLASTPSVKKKILLEILTSFRSVRNFVIDVRQCVTKAYI